MAGVPPRHRADARAGALGRVRHDAHQRPEGVRHRAVRGTRLQPGRRERHRAGDVAHVVRRRQRLRPRLGDRHVPVPARHPGARAQRAPLPQRGELMEAATTEAPRADAAAVITNPDERPAARIARFAARLPMQILMAAIALLWLVPTFGLLLTSLMPAGSISQQGWWKVVQTPSMATLDNYRAIFDNNSITDALWTTVAIAVGNTLLLVIVAALAGYAFAWLSFPGRDVLFVVVIGLLVVPIQVALIPIFSLYNSTALFDTIFGIMLFHVAFGMPFAIFLLRNFFAGIPRDILESARIDGASEMRIFFRLILPLGLPAIASLAIFRFLWTWND